MFSDYRALLRIRIRKVDKERSVVKPWTAWQWGPAYQTLRCVCNSFIYHVNVNYKHLHIQVSGRVERYNQWVTKMGWQEWVLLFPIHIWECVPTHIWKAIIQPLCYWWLIWAIQNDANNLKNDWTPGIRVLIWEYLARAIKRIQAWQGLDDFQKPLCFCALDETSLIIRRVKKCIAQRYWFIFSF